MFHQHKHAALHTVFMRERMSNRVDHRVKSDQVSAFVVLHKQARLSQTRTKMCVKIIVENETTNLIDAESKVPAHIIMVQRTEALL